MGEKPKQGELFPELARKKQKRTKWRPKGSVRWDWTKEAKPPSPEEKGQYLAEQDMPEPNPDAEHVSEDEVLLAWKAYGEALKAAFHREPGASHDNAWAKYLQFMKTCKKAGLPWKEMEQLIHEAMFPPDPDLSPDSEQGKEGKKAPR